MNLTERQQEVLEILKGFIEENEYPPTLQELADLLDVKNLSGIRGHLLALEKKGFIKRDRTCRGIIVND